MDSGQIKPWLGQGMGLDEQSDMQRIVLKDLGKKIDDLKQITMQAGDKEGVNKGEIIANLTLCYRHIEDAAMRLGKVKQHNNDGESIYDKNVVGSK